MAQKNIVAFIDAPDPDNFVMVSALCRLNPTADVRVVLTGRPVLLDKDKRVANWAWDIEGSRMAQQVSALRLNNFLDNFNIHVAVYDGGIAPRTLVPHHLHFEDYWKFNDVDPLQAICGASPSNLHGLRSLISEFVNGRRFSAVVGGPMTGLNQMLIRCPELAKQIDEVHAMFGTWGNVKLMDLGDGPRGAVQFNVACDPQAAHSILFGVDCPVFLLPTEVTRVSEIGFQDAQQFREFLLPGLNSKTESICRLYDIWYDAAIKPRQAKNREEKIFIHDLASAFSLDSRLRNEIYDMSTIELDRVPHLPNEAEDWGKIIMRPSQLGHKRFTRYAATGLQPDGAKVYLDTLKQIFS